MKIIIPMAGLGKRMRPHTLTTPKPLIHIAGKSIVEHLLDEIHRVCKEPIDEVAFITGDFGQEAETKLKEAARAMGAKGSIYYQEEPLGTAHAILCAAPSLEGNIIVAFADTLFFADFNFDANKDAIIWTHKVEDPSAFGVVLCSENGKIRGFKEKPKEFVSDKAIIGIYYFKDGKGLRKELRYLLDNNIQKNGEYQLTDALQNMLDKDISFYVGQVDEWLDCGNKNATLDTHKKVLELKKGANSVHPTAKLQNTQLIPPCYIGENVNIESSVIGPDVSIGKNTNVQNSLISDTIIQEYSKIKGIYANRSMIGSHTLLEKNPDSFNISDYSQVE